MKHHLLEIVNSIKLGILTGVTTTSIGISTIDSVPDEFKLFGWIPEDIGRLAALIGVVLTTILAGVAVNNWRNGRLDTRIKELSIRKMEQDLED